MLFPKSKVAKAFEVVADNVLSNNSYRAKVDTGLRNVFNQLMKFRNK